MKKLAAFRFSFVVLNMFAAPIFAEMITKEGAFACTDKDYFQKSVGYVAQGDNAAFMKAFSAGLATNLCTTFKRGEKVFRTGGSWGLVKVRREGELQEYWTVSEVVS
jgi:hypothetical protein